MCQVYYQLSQLVRRVIDVSTRAHQGLLQPTKGQVQRLVEMLDAHRQLYNAALEERRGAWRLEHRSVTRFEQYSALTGWDHPLLSYGVTPARGTLLRLDRAFQSFFRRARRGERPGFPRFQGDRRFESVEYPGPSCWRVQGSRLYLKGIGHIRFLQSRRGIRGTPKTLVVRREGNRFRFTVFCTEVPEQRLALTGESVGIDLGVTALVATSEGGVVANPRWLRNSLASLAEAQQVVAGRRRGSNRRHKAGEAAGRLHRKIARQRRDHHHRLSRRLVDRYDVIVHEDLAIANLVRRPAPRLNPEGGHDPNGAAAKSGLNREILSAGWGQLLRMTAYKAEEAGRQVIAVDPRHTSQRCHACGHVAAGNRVDAAFRCLRCGHVDHADVNAARNILRAGLALRRAREAA
jgi:putative transposase